MIIRHALLAIFTILSLPDFAPAQDSGKDVPKPPYVRRLDLNTEWKVVVTPKKAKETPRDPAELKRQQERELRYPPLEGYVAYKNADLIQIISKWKGGKTTEAYFVGGNLLKIHNPNEPYVQVHQPSLGEACPDYRETDFPELLWVNLNTFTNAASENGRPCYVYKQNGAKAQEAWIDKATLLPIRYDDGENIHTYTYANVGPRQVTPPPNFQRWIKRMARGN